MLRSALFGLVAIVLLFDRSARAESSSYAVAKHSTPQVWCPSETRRVAVTFRNTGARAWSPKTHDRVSYHWRDTQGGMVHRDGLRTDFDAEVAVGAHAEVLAKVTAPSTPGSYVLVWRMLTEGAGWFPEPVSYTHLTLPTTPYV